MERLRQKGLNVLWSAGAVLLAVAVLTGCSEASGMNTGEAKKSVVAFVEGSTGVVGDGWEVSDGPGLGKCGLGLGQGGIQYVYAMVHDASADPKADVAAVERQWKKLGVATERYQTGGEDPILGVRGRGGPVSSSDFRADPRGYTIDSSSHCVPGDFDKMSRDSPE